MEEYSIKNYSFFGLPVSGCTFDLLENWILDSVQTNKRRTIYGYSLYAIYALRKMPEIYTLGSKADLFLTDGRPFFWLCKIFKLPINAGISIPQFVIETLRKANEKHFSVMLLGATKDINDKAYANLKIKYPNIVLLAGTDGYYKDDEEIDIIKLINKNNPDILLVGMSSPKKERFVFKNKEVLSAKIVIPCGGMIDVLAGKTRMAPSWIKKMGLASVFRIIQEPGRLLFDRIKMLFFLFTDFFPLLCIKNILNRKDFSIPEYYIKTN